MAPTPTFPVPAVNCHAQAQIDAARANPNSKRIFVFCDGTGNRFAAKHGDKNANSNVVKLYITLRVNNDQVAYYHPGVGTMGDPTIRHWLPRFWSKVKGLAFGAGFRDNVLDAYRYLMTVYNDGDQIYVFGFSRGAYTARALAGMLHAYGLLCRGNEGHVAYVWTMFHAAVKGGRKKLKQKASLRPSAAGHSIERNFAFLQTYSRKVTIRFMGLWDTVSSVGWIYKPVRLLDMAQNPSIQVGRHAVSIDERRAYYRDNLWGPPVDIDHPEWPDDLRSRGISQDLAQVWFPGVHSDVGGSYPQWETAPANEALTWMLSEVQQHGAELCQERIAMVLGAKTGVCDADAIFHPPPRKGHCLHESLTWKWWLLQCFPQQYYDKEDRKIQWRVPYGTARFLPHHSVVHGSAERQMRSMEEAGYEPHALRLQDLTPIGDTSTWTTADLRGCFVYDARRDLKARRDAVVLRYAKLVVGWVTFGLFWALLLAVGWFLLKLCVWAAALVVELLQKTPGLIRWVELVRQR